MLDPYSKPKDSGGQKPSLLKLSYINSGQGRAGDLDSPDPRKNTDVYSSTTSSGSEEADTVRALGAGSGLSHGVTIKGEGGKAKGKQGRPKKGSGAGEMRRVKTQAPAKLGQGIANQASMRSQSLGMRTESLQGDIAAVESQQSTVVNMNDRIALPILRRYVAKQFEAAPRFLDQIGMCYDGPPLGEPLFALTQEIAGGLIQRFPFFKNVFQRDAYEAREIDLKSGKEVQRKKSNSPDPRDPTDLLKDHGIQVTELQSCSDTCYPSRSKPMMEQELEEFAKQVVGTVNQVLANSAALIQDCNAAGLVNATDIQSIDKSPMASPKHSVVGTASAMRSSLADPVSRKSIVGVLPGRKTSSMSVPASVMGFTQVMQASEHVANKTVIDSNQGGSNNPRNGLYVQIDKLNEEIEALKETVLEKDRLMNKARKDYTRDLQNLRNALTLAVDPINRGHAEQVKLTVEVYNFNDLEGLPKELVDFFNEKMTIVCEKAQQQIDQVTQNVASLVEKIEKYKSLKPNNYQLMEMNVNDICDGLAVIEPLAFPIWQRIMAAYPQNHFAAIIKQVAEQMNDDHDETYDKLALMVQEGIRAGATQTEKMLEVCRERNQKNHQNILEALKELDLEKWRQQGFLEKQEKLQQDINDKFLKEELSRIKKEYEHEKKQMASEITSLKRENDQLKRANKNSDFRICLFKWRQVGIYTRFIQELKNQYLDTDSLRTLLHEDMQKLFFGNEISALTNSLSQQKALAKTTDERCRAAFAELHELRLKVNRLMQERQQHLVKLERYRVREWDWCRMHDVERKARYAAVVKEKQAVQKQEEMASMLARQIKLKEMCEDRLRDTLDMKFNFNDDMTQEENDEAAEKRKAEKATTNAELKQKQLKRILKGFKVEMHAVLMQNQDRLNQKVETVFDLNHGLTHVEAECQTEIQGVVSRKLEVQVVHERPYAIQSSKVPMVDSSTQSELSKGIIDFLAGGSQKFEQIHLLGLISAVDLRNQKPNVEPIDDYVSNLIEQEQKGGLVFTQRKRNIFSKLETVQDSKSKGKADMSRVNSSTVSVSSQQSGSKPSFSNGHLGVPHHSRHQVGKKSSQMNRSGGRQSRNELSRAATSPNDRRREDSSDSDRKKRKKRKKHARAHPSGYSDEEQIILAPKLNQKKKRKNRDLSDSELNQTSSDDSSSGSSNSYQEASCDRQPEKETALVEREKMTEAPDYRRIVAMRNATSSFKNYLDLFELMVDIEPKLLKEATKVLKSQQQFKFDIDELKNYNRLFPEMVPDVFSRLWKREKDEPAQRLERRKLVMMGKKAWRKRLVDQGRLDPSALDASDLEDPAYPDQATAKANADLTQAAASLLAAEAQQLQQQCTRAAVASETATQNNSMPYLNPININISPDLESVVSPKRTKEKDTFTKTTVLSKSGGKSTTQHLRMKRYTSPQPPGSSKKAHITASRNIQQLRSRGDSTMTEILPKHESVDVQQHLITARVDARKAVQANSNLIQSGGFFSLPKNPYEMRVTILPRNHQKFTASVQVPETTPPLRAGMLSEAMSKHFSFDTSGKAASASATPRLAQSGVSRSQRIVNKSLTQQVKQPTIARLQAPNQRANTSSSLVFQKVQPGSREAVVALATAASAGSQGGGDKGQIVAAGVVLDDTDAEVVFHTIDGNSTGQLQSSGAALQPDQNLKFSSEDGPPLSLINQIVSGEQNVLSRTSLLHSKVLSNLVKKQKRPATCKLAAQRGGAAKRQSKMRSSSGPNYHIANTKAQHSQRNFVRKRFAEGLGGQMGSREQTLSHLASSKLHDTMGNQASSRPMSGSNIEESIQLALRQGTTSSTIPPSRQATGTTSYNKQCPVRAFDMSNIPISQHERMRSSLLMNFKTQGATAANIFSNNQASSVAMSAIFENQKIASNKSRHQRAQSATYYKTSMAQSLGQRAQVALKQSLIASGDGTQVQQHDQDHLRQINISAGGNGPPQGQIQQQYNLGNMAELHKKVVHTFNISSDTDLKHRASSIVMTAEGRDASSQLDVQIAQEELPTFHGDDASEKLKQGSHIKVADELDQVRMSATDSQK